MLKEIRAPMVIRATFARDLTGIPEWQWKLHVMRENTKIKRKIILYLQSRGKRRYELALESEFFGGEMERNRRGRGTYIYSGSIVGCTGHLGILRTSDKMNILKKKKQNQDIYKYMYMKGWKIQVKSAFSHTCTISRATTTTTVNTS